MRILHVIAAVADVYGGPSRVARQMCRSLAARGHEVSLVTTDAAFGERLQVPLEQPVESDGYTTWYSACPRPTNPHWAPGVVERVLALAPRVDVAHIHGVFNFPSTASLWALRRQRRAYVVRPCGALNRYGLAQRGRRKQIALALVERANLEGARLIQASSAPERDDLVALGLDRVEVVPQGVDVEGIGSAGAPPLEYPYVLFMGRLATVKGLPRLVRAFASLAPSDLRLVLAGPDEYGHQREVERVVGRAGVAERVVFTGMVGGEQKWRWLAHARMFALASDSESFGVAAVEAAAHGLPLLVTNGVGISEQVESYRAGVVVAPKEDTIAAGLHEILEAPERFRAGAHRLAASFSWQRTTEKLESHYERVRDET